MRLRVEERDIVHHLSSLLMRTRRDSCASSVQAVAARHVVKIVAEVVAGMADT